MSTVKHRVALRPTCRTRLCTTVPIVPAQSRGAKPLNRPALPSIFTMCLAGGKSTQVSKVPISILKNNSLKSDFRCSTKKDYHKAYKLHKLELRYNKIILVDCHRIGMCTDMIEKWLFTYMCLFAAHHPTSNQQQKQPRPKYLSILLRKCVKECENSPEQRFDTLP